MGIVNKLTVSDDLTHFDFCLGKYPLILLEEKERVLGRNVRDQIPHHLAHPLPMHRPESLSYFHKTWHLICALLGMTSKPLPLYLAILPMAPAKIKTRLGGCPLPGKLKQKRDLILYLLFV